MKVLMLLAIVVLTFANMSDVCVEHNAFGRIAFDEGLQPIPHDFQLLKAAEALTDTARPLFGEFLGGEVFELGYTYNDMQHNSTVGRSIALDDYGNAHIAWMFSPNASLSSRNIRYNFVGADAYAPLFSEGLRSDAAISRSGFCNIDAIGCTPYIAYHQTHSPDGIIHTQVSWDAASIETDCMIAGGFSPAIHAPPAIPYPECPDDRENIVDIWPKISISRYTTDVHIVTTTSKRDSFVCGGTLIEPKNYIAYYHGTTDPPSGDITFTTGIALVDNKGVSPDIATARTRNEVAIAYIYRGDYECNWPDSTNIFLLRSTDNGETWDWMSVTRFGACFLHDRLDTFYYAGRYILDIDSSTTPFDTIIGWVVDTMVAYSRPNRGLSIMYDEEDHIHITWTETMYLPELCGESVTVFPGTNLRHWTDRYPDVYSYPIGAFPVRTPYAGGDPSSNPYYNSSSFSPSVSVNLDDGTLYCIWQQFYGEFWWMRYFPEGDFPGIVYYDKSAGEYANEGIFISYSDDHGRTWKGPLHLSNTYTPFCEPGDCKSEIFATIAKTTDDYIHVAYIEDRDAGLAIHGGGEFVSNPVKYARVPTDRVRAAADVVDRISYFVTAEYPDTLLIGGIDPSDLGELDSLFPDLIRPIYGVEEPKFIDKPTSFDLAMNFPNPFNAITMISYQITEADHYILEVYDMSGKLVSVLANTFMNPGKYEVAWRGIDMAGNPLESGNYLYRIRDSQGRAIVRKMTLVK